MAAARPEILVVIALLCLILGYQLTQLNSGGDSSERNPRGRPSAAAKKSYDDFASKPLTKAEKKEEKAELKLEKKEEKQLKKSGKETKEEVAELEADGVALMQIMKGYYTSATDCPESGTPILDISHNVDANHGDVCRDKMPDWGKWTCPKGCTASSPITKSPYCEMPHGFGGGPCRIKAPVACTGNDCKLIK